MRKLNGNGKSNGVEVIRPLEHRPEVMVVKSADGRHKVFGDGKALDTREFIAVHEAIGPVISSADPSPPWTDDERAELSEAEERLQRAEALLDRLRAERAAMAEQWERAEDESERRRLYEAAHEHKARIEEAEALAKQARVAMNATKKRITEAARLRRDHPHLVQRAATLDERLEAMEQKR